MPQMMQSYQVQGLQHKADRAAFLTISCRKIKIKNKWFTIFSYFFWPTRPQFRKKKWNLLTLTILNGPLLYYCDYHIIIFIIIFLYHRPNTVIFLFIRGHETLLQIKTRNSTSLQMNTTGKGENREVSQACGYRYRYEYDKCRPDTSRRQRRRLPPCPLVTALVPLKCSSVQICKTHHRVPFTQCACIHHEW